MNETTLWGIHAGQHGDADNLFLTRKVVAVGWPRVGDLSKLRADREAFKAAVSGAYPDKPGAVPVNGGQLFRFVHEIQVGDLVLYPSKHERKIHYGRVEGGYRYDAEASPHYPNQRPVTWVKTVLRTSFSQGALYEIGAGMSLFQLKNYADEFRAVLQGRAAPPPVAVENDPAVGFIAQDVEETTRDFILKTLAQELKGHPLAEFVAHLLNTMGYRTRLSPPGPDGGIDIVAHPDELGFQPPIIKVQVKSTQGSTGDPEVSALYGKVGANEHGLLVTLGSFTGQAVGFARTKSNLRLVDGKELVDLILAHYEQFESRYKGILPLKRVYIPEPINDQGE